NPKRERGSLARASGWCVFSPNPYKTCRARVLAARLALASSSGTVALPTLPLQLVFLASLCPPPHLTSRHLRRRICTFIPREESGKTRQSFARIAEREDHENLPAKICCRGRRRGVVAAGRGGGPCSAGRSAGKRHLGSGEWSRSRGVCRAHGNDPATDPCHS